ncbi:hypothetical protein [Larkinella humicola]|uniref:YD repeat-containing protein n=1 Tax=Larkinella humicola TaxID=2607654 RepID=A0A5N1J9B9_9BACT|nr:hypothetical protein [Larkinella humicola]KAA9349247.1 hypothetical protein F0P93_22905 [Larkinella humicola]
MDALYYSPSITPKDPKVALEIDGKQVEFGLFRHEEFSYDSEGRLSQITTLPVPFSPNDGKTDRYEYQPNQVIRYFSYTGTLEEKTVYTPDQFGNIYPPRNAEYDSDGFIVKNTYVYSTGKEAFTDGTDEYTIENGNIVKHIRIVPQLNRRQVTLFEYDLSKPNLPQIRNFEPRQSKNLPTQIITYWTFTGQTESNPYNVVSYRYTFDESSQIKRVVAVGDTYSGTGQKIAGSTSYSFVDYKISCQ